MDLQIDPKKIRVGTLRKLEQGKIEALYDLVHDFAVDDDGEPMAVSEADAFLDDMTSDEATEWMQRATATLNEAAVPPQTSRSSSNGAKARDRRRSG